MTSWVVLSVLARACALLFRRLGGAVKAELRAAWGNSRSRRENPVSRDPDAIHQGTLSNEKENTNAPI